MADRDTWELIEGADGCGYNGGMRWRPRPENVEQTSEKPNPSAPLIVLVCNSVRTPIGVLVKGAVELTTFGRQAERWIRL